MSTTLIATEKKSSPRITLGAHGHLVIPQKTVKRLGLRAGTELDLVERNNVIMLVPRTRLSRDQQWYESPRWQKMMQEAFDDVGHGRVAGPFKNAEDLIKELHS